MTRVAQVNLAYNIHTLWFDPNGVEDIQPGDKLVVETARGTEMGVAASEVVEVTEEEIENLKSPLKPVLRKATEEDVEKAAEMDALAAEAMPIFKELAAEVAEDMHPVSVEYLLSGDKAVFYFESEDRVDFRDLVRQLASRLHVRIDMRQIGVRDEARIVGGLAHCGQVVCCERLGGEFNPVSIRMAKNQDLSLNPQKISGLCGRLMCCLRYEDDAYKEFKGRAPKVGSSVETPDGPAEVIELNVPRETVKMRVGEEKPISVPLADFEKPKGGKRPNAVGEEAWEEAKTEDMFATSVLANFQTSQFTGNDKLGSAKAIHHTTSRNADSGQSSRGRRKSDRRDGAGQTREASRNRKRSGRRKGDFDIVNVSDEHLSSKTDATRKPRRRKSVTISAGDSDKAKAVAGTQAKSDAGSRAERPEKTDRKARNGKSGRSDRKNNARNGNGRNRNRQEHGGQGEAVGGSGLRPGHRSSGLSHADEQGAAKGEGGRSRASRQGAGKPNSGAGGNNNNGPASDGNGGNGNRRKPRRRPRKS